MKKLGIIGGAGPLASALLYESIVRESYMRSLEVPEIMLINYPFSSAISVEEGSQNKELILTELSACIKTMVDSSVDLAILACNTLHLYLEKLLVENLDFLHIPNAILNCAHSRAHKSLLFLGTQNSCSSNLYGRSDIEIIYPSADKQRIVNKVIENILSGDIREHDSYLLSRLICERASEVSFDGVILGCTDLPVLHHHYPIACKQTIYDTIKIPARLVRGIL